MAVMDTEQDDLDVPHTFDGLLPARRMNRLQEFFLVDVCYLNIVKQMILGRQWPLKGV